MGVTVCFIEFIVTSLLFLTNKNKQTYIQSDSVDKGEVKVPEKQLGADGKERTIANAIVEKAKCLWRLRVNVPNKDSLKLER
jgi:hypothetical protein